MKSPGFAFSRSASNGAHFEVGVLQGVGSPRAGLLVQDARVLVRPDRHVELAFAIDPVQAVEAGLVQVDEHRRPLRGGNAPALVVAFANLVVALLRVTAGESAQRRDHAFHVVTNRRVCATSVGLMSVSSARPGRREKKSAPPPTNGSTWRMCSTPEGSSGRSWLSNRPLPPTHFTKGAASRGCCSILAATAADVVICSMITYTDEKTEKTARCGEFRLISATWARLLGVGDHGAEPIDGLFEDGIGGPNEKRMCSTNREGRPVRRLPGFTSKKCPGTQITCRSRAALKKSSLLRSEAAARSGLPRRRRSPAARGRT